MIRNIQHTLASRRVRALMRVLFGIFIFLYFYFLQSPLLELLQHRLSQGRTVYYQLISSVVLTLLLMVVQRLVSKWIHFSDSLYFFSYVPSVIIALLLTAFVPQTNFLALEFSAVALLVFVIVSCFCLKRKTPENRGENSYPKLLATHGSGLMGVLFCLGAFSNTSDIQIYESLAAHHIHLMRYEQALNIGRSSLSTSPRLTALRAYAMSHTPAGMGDRLFTYPLSGVGAEQLLLAPADSLSQLLSSDSLYLNMTVWRSPKESALDFCHRAAVRNDSTFVNREYWLTALLLEKQLDRFVNELRHGYSPIDSVHLPKHYQEALALYSCESGKSVSFRGDSTMKRAYYEFDVQQGIYTDSLSRTNFMRRKFGNTYWWYYWYQH